MGIRISKRMGYALTDLGQGEFADEHTFDSRLTRHPSELFEELDENPDARVKRMAAWARKTKEYYRTEREAKEGRSFFFTFLKCNEAWKRDASLSDFIYTPSDDSSVLLFMPISIDKERWYRHDDLMDHLEFSLTQDLMIEKGYQNEESWERIINIPYGIYPYEGTYINKRTGMYIPEISGIGEKVIKEVSQKLVDEGRGDQIQESWSKIGFTDAQDILDNLKMEVPIEIVVMAKFLNIFKDPMTVHSLKSIIHTSWG